MPAHFQSRLILGGISILLLAGAYYAFFGGSPTTPGPGATACPSDARQCPNGSYVGRVGPSCEFAVCPEGPSPVDVSTTFNQAAKAGNLLITPKTLLEDSRCPVGVQCIQAGTVRIQAEVNGPSGTSSILLELGVQSTTEAETITLIGVYPGRTEGKTIALSDYQFTFHVASR